MMERDTYAPDWMVDPGYLITKLDDGRDLWIVRFLIPNGGIRYQIWIDEVVQVNIDYHPWRGITFQSRALDDASMADAADLCEQLQTALVIGKHLDQAMAIVAAENGVIQ